MKPAPSPSTQALIALVACLSAGATVAGEEPRTDPRVGSPALSEWIDVTLRPIDFLALDRKGRPITDLRLEEVGLREDGEKQVVVALQSSHDNPACCVGVTGAGVLDDTGWPPAAEPGPGIVTERSRGRWIVFFFDARNLSVPSRLNAAKSISELVAEGLQPSDRAALIVGEEDVRVVVPFTTRRERLLGYLERPDSFTRSRRDMERRLKDLREDAESCRTAPKIVDCARQSTSTYLLQTSRETEASLLQLESLLRGLSAIPDRKILFYISDGLILNPGDVAAAAVEHAIGQVGYNLSAMRSFLSRDYSPRLDRLYHLAAVSRTGFYPVNAMRRMIDDVFSAERGLDFGPENLPQLRTDPFEATWEQVYSFHEGIARTTGGMALFKRQPGDDVKDLLRSAAGVYTLYYEPQSLDFDRKRIDISIDRRGARAIHRSSYKESSIDPPFDLAGSLTVDPEAYDELTRKVPVRLSVSGAALALAPGSEPPVSFMSLFFEVRDADNRPTQDLFQIISLPRGTGVSVTYGDVTYPFLLRLPPGSYTLRVHVRDLNGPGRGSYLQAFSVGRGKASPKDPDPDAGH